MPLFVHDPNRTLVCGRIRVWVQIAWTGAVGAVCHVGDAATSTLVGATTDSLLIAR